MLLRYMLCSIVALAQSLVGMDRKRGWRNQLRKLVINCNKQNYFQFLQKMGRCWKYYMKNKGIF